MHIDTGDTAWMLISSALVMLMTPGLAMFYGGMVRAKNVLAMLIQNFFMLGLISLVWFVAGYSLAFGSDAGGVIGQLHHAFLAGVGGAPRGETTIPATVFMVFQLMFAIITPALFTGAVAERARFGGLMLFTVLWSLLVYSPIAHWVWGDGWLMKLGALDFAGGTVVHINAGIAALALILVIGPRIGHRSEPMPPHNLPLTLLGAGLLWFGWFGFNAGSALGANALAGSAFMATHLAAASATVSWVFVEWAFAGKPTTLGAASGCIAGLVAITPAAGFVGAPAAVLIGAAAGAVCYGAVCLKARVGYDDSLDVVGIHCVGGVLGALLTGVFASKAISPAGADGLIYGNVAQFGIQALAVLVTLVYSFGISFVLLKIVQAVVGLRVSPDSEIAGTDATEHAERGYVLH